MEDWIAQNIDVHGPIAVFVLLMLSGIGLPLGEDIINIPAGMLVGGGHLPAWPTLLAAYLGVTCSDMLWFMICRLWGVRLLHKRWFKRLVHPRRLLEAKHQMEERGAWMVVLARFIPASRTTTITVAGLLHMPIWKFAVATFSCVLITAPAQIGAGMLIAHGLNSESTTNRVTMMIGVVMLIIAGLLVLRFFRRHRRHGGRPPRAKARWLRRFRIRRPHMRFPRRKTETKHA